MDDRPDVEIRGRNTVGRVETNTHGAQNQTVLTQERLAGKHGERERRVTEAGLVRGRHYLEWVETLDQWRSEKRDDEALELLLEIIDATERAARMMNSSPPPGYTKRAAVIYRRRKDYAAEIAVIERYLMWEPGSEKLAGRLAKARELREGSV